jgi:hypothetical protein
MELKNKLALDSKIRRQGVPENVALRATDTLALFRAIKVFAWEGTDISDEAAATLTLATINGFAHLSKPER